MGIQNVQLQEWMQKKIKRENRSHRTIIVI